MKDAGVFGGGVFSGFRKLPLEDSMVSLVKKATPGGLPRSDRVLCHYFQESVRDYISNADYLDLTLEAKGVMQVL
jgi:hypothetical protein